MESVVI